MSNGDKILMVDQTVNVLDVVIAEWTEERYCSGSAALDEYGFLLHDMNSELACRWCALGYIEKCCSVNTKGYALFNYVHAVLNECLTAHGVYNIDFIDINDTHGWRITHGWLEETVVYLQSNVVDSQA